MSATLFDKGADKKSTEMPFAGQLQNECTKPNQEDATIG
jgi:hypothetical protein